MDCRGFARFQGQQATLTPQRALFASYAPCKVSNMPSAFLPYLPNLVRLVRPRLHFFKRLTLCESELSIVNIPHETLYLRCGTSRRTTPIAFQERCLTHQAPAEAREMAVGQAPGEERSPTVEQGRVADRTLEMGQALVADGSLHQAGLTTCRHHMLRRSRKRCQDQMASKHDCWNVPGYDLDGSHS